MILPLYVIIVGLALCFESVQSVDHQGSILRLELSHRDTFRLNQRKPGTGVPRIGEIVQNDMKRHTMVSQRRFSRLNHRKRRNIVETSRVEMPLHSGRDYGTGQYLTELKVGTPAQKFTMVVDTGSELTWVNCRYRCGSNCRKRRRINRRRVFQAHLSSSFRTVPCFSQMCKIDLMNLFSLATCPSPLNPCAYDYRYLDGSAATGIFAKETVSVSLTNGREARLHDLLVGCSESFKGQSFNRADGVIGLANSKFSFSAKATDIFGGKFSYCLVDHLSHNNVSNYLIFGSHSNNTKSQSNTLLASRRYTKLELELIPPFYAVNIKGISLGDEMLHIPRDVWAAKRGGGTILDSGTSLTFLLEPAYRPLIMALDTYVSKFKRIKLKGVPMEYCFNSTGYNESEMPKIIFHLGDGARFEPHRKSYVIDVADRVKCLGLVSAGLSGTNIIGNIMQQNYLWEFDFVRTTLAFAPSTCA